MNILFGLLKVLLGMKFGWLIAIVAGVILAGSIIRNIFTGSFNAAKFVGGFNIFAGGVQGKLIYYAIIGTILLAIYGKIMQPTSDFDNTYKNNVHHNDDVVIDQRQIIESQEDTLLIGIKIFGLKIGITVKGIPKPREIIDNANVDKTTKLVNQKQKIK